jgi:hypothetical protein
MDWKMRVNNELGGMWKEMVVVLFEIIARNSPSGAGEDHKIAAFWIFRV